jgi:hypothetical protein
MVEDGGSKAFAGTFLDPHSGQPTRLVLTLPAGKYRAEWVDPKTGKSTSEALNVAGGGADVTLTTPAYEQDIALRLLPE